jgi:putative addiction module killer protein
MRFPLEIYCRTDGSAPYREWLAGLRDRVAVSRIRARLDRVQAGNFGDYKTVGQGIVELRFMMGPGYRIYLTRRANTLIVLCGGDKSTQAADIAKARMFSEDYWRRA